MESPHGTDKSSIPEAVVPLLMGKRKGAIEEANTDKNPIAEFAK
jgi:hypothetical protein